MNSLVTVTVDGRRWRRCKDAEALRSASASDRVFVLDAATGAVRFGDGVHGASPPSGSLVRVTYRQGGGDAGNVEAVWIGRWPPRPFPLAAALQPVGGSDDCGRGLA